MKKYFFRGKRQSRHKEVWYIYNTACFNPIIKLFDLVKTQSCARFVFFLGVFPFHGNLSRRRCLEMDKMIFLPVVACRWVLLKNKCQQLHHHWGVSVDRIPPLAEGNLGSIRGPSTFDGHEKPCCAKIAELGASACPKSDGLLVDGGCLWRG